MLLKFSSFTTHLLVSRKNTNHLKISNIIDYFREKTLTDVKFAWTIKRIHGWKLYTKRITGCKMIRRYENCKKDAKSKWNEQKKPRYRSPKNERPFIRLAVHSKGWNIKVGLFILFSRIALSRMVKIVEREPNRTRGEKSRGRVTPA